SRTGAVQGDPGPGLHSCCTWRAQAQPAVPVGRPPADPVTLPGDDRLLRVPNRGGPVLTRLSLGLGVLLLMVGLAPAAPEEPTPPGTPLRDWVEALKDRDPFVREEALLVLGDLGPAARDAVPAITPLLTEDAAFVRVRAALALWKIDRRGKETVPVLVV